MKTSGGRPELSLAVIEDLKGKGYTQSDIPEMFGVTRQAVSWHKHHYGGRMSAREVVFQHFPWKVPAEQGVATQYRRMRDHFEWLSDDRVNMTEDRLKRLRAFYRKLREENLVVEFDPNLPPTPGVASKGGFAYRERLLQDEDFLIRVNEYTRITEEGDSLCRFPAVEP